MTAHHNFLEFRHIHQAERESDGHAPSLQQAHNSHRAKKIRSKKPIKLDQIRSKLK